MPLAKNPSAPADSPDPPHTPPVAVDAVPAPPSDAEAVDMEIFNQILELDEDGSHEFSKEMVSAYFLQATTTFTDMDKALTDKKLPELSSLGHFLKGSSATLGIVGVQAACRKMQDYGDLRGDDAKSTIEPKEALERIRVLLPEAKAEYAEAERWLRKFYADQDDAFDDDPAEPDADR